MSTSNYTKEIVNDYCVLDTETTGLSAYYDDVIEIGLLRVRNNVVVEKYQQLINPGRDIDPYITTLTGITNDMVEGKPSIIEIKDKVFDFIGDDIILGHNTSFDIRFLKAGFSCNIDNPYMDTMQFARKLFPQLPHHRLSDLTEYFSLTNNEHRALADCISTKELYDVIKKTLHEKGLKIEDIWTGSRFSRGIDINSIKPEIFDINEDGFFYHQHVVFTGKLEKMGRKDAMQIVVNLGGILDNSVNKNTNYLILGNNDYNPILRGEKSAKQKKAEQLKLNGQAIDIIDEFTFYDIIFDKDDVEKTVIKQQIPLNVDDSPAEFLHDIQADIDRLSKAMIEAIDDVDFSQGLSVNRLMNGEKVRGLSIKARNLVVATLEYRKTKRSVMKIRVTGLKYFEGVPIDEIGEEVFTINISSIDDVIVYAPQLAQVYMNIMKDFERESFGCCSRYIECSDAKQCVHPNKVKAEACQYKTNLDKGIIFYGKNRNTQ